MRSEAGAGCVEGVEGPDRPPKTHGCAVAARAAVPQPEPEGDGEGEEKGGEVWPWRTERCVGCGVVAPFWNVRAGGGCSSRFFARRFCPGCGAEQVDGGRDVKDKRDVRGEAGEDGDIETDLDTDPDPDGEGDGDGSRMEWTDGNG